LSETDLGAQHRPGLRWAADGYGEEFPDIIVPVGADGGEYITRTAHSEAPVVRGQRDAMLMMARRARHRGRSGSKPGRGRRLAIRDPRLGRRTPHWGKSID
jgi:hypothetical protein